MAIMKREAFLGLDAADQLSDRGANRYQAVLAAAKTARRLNETKVSEYDAEGNEAERTLEAHKVTSMALEMLLAGEIEYKQREESTENVPQPTL